MHTLLNLLSSPLTHLFPPTSPLTTDAHEFSYMMDLCAESKRFDPDGNYVRRWLPVLARLPAKYIHAPWEAPERVLDDAGGWREGRVVGG